MSIADISAKRPRSIAGVLRGLVITAGVYALAIALLVPVMDHVVLNGTASVKANVLWKTPQMTIEKGDYVLAPARHELIPSTYTHLTKLALCVPGERLTFDGTRFRCNGAVLNAVKPATRTGIPLTPFAWEEGVIPEGRMFVGSPHPDGFDSRYLGLFAIDDLVRLEPLL